MPVSAGKRIKFPLLTTTALVGATMFGVAQVAPVSVANAANIVITNTVGATQSLDTGDTLSVTSTGVLSGGVEVNTRVVTSIINDGTISAPVFGIRMLWTSDITGGITNNGNILSGIIGIGMQRGDISGGVTNNAGGTISGASYGIFLSSNANISGGITNSGTISSGSLGIMVNSNSDISGGITNSGAISGSTFVGIQVSNFSDIGGIINNASGTISGGIYGIYVRSLSDISGAVTNSGTILGNSAGIYVRNTSDISGGIINNIGGTISGADIGIYSSINSDVSGGIINSGSITGANQGITVSSALISGGITNNVGGIISGGSTGIYAGSNSDISGGIANSGTITGNIGIQLETSSSISGGITNYVGGIIEGTGGTAIDLSSLSAATPITINGGRIIGDVVDDGTLLGFSDVTVAGDFTTEGNFMVSDLTVSAGQILTISAGDTVSLYDMSASAGTFSFAVDSTASAGQLIVTNGNVDLSGASVTATVLNAGANLTSGMEILVANGNAQVTGLTGGAGQIATSITDDSVLWSFQIADGSQAEVTTGGADNTEIYMIAMQVAMAADTATTPNNRAVGAVFDDLAGTGDPELSDIITNINAAGDAAELDAILEATLPTVDGGALAGGLRLSQNTLDITRTQLASLRDGSAATGMAAGDGVSGLRAWGQVFGEHGEQDRRDNVAGYDADTFGLAVGFDTQNAAEDTALGIALSYGHTDVDSENTNRTETDVDGYQLTLYGDHDFDDRTYITGLLGYVYGDNESTRHDVGGVAGLTADADYASHQFVAEVETGRDYQFGGMKLTPNVLASYTYYSAEDYTEEGAGGANLNVENEDLQMLELGVGLTAGWEHQTDAGGVLKPELRAGYRYDVIGDPVAATSRFTGGGAAFKTEGFDPAQGSINAGAGLTYTTPDNWELSARYDYEFKQDFDAHSGLLKAAYKF